MEVKRCASCREILPTSEFIPRRDKPDKFLPRCRACRALEQKSKEAKNRAKRSERNTLRSSAPKSAQPMKRSAIKPMSDKRKAVNVKRKEAMLDHFGSRETWECTVQGIIGTPCFGEINGHEILSRARAGRSDENLLDMSGIILVCNHHNSWIEDNPTKAHELGLTKHSWE